METRPQTSKFESKFQTQIRKLSSIASDNQSHMTILRPRDSVSYDAFSQLGAVMVLDDKEIWKKRVRFFFRTLCFSLGLGNIWRYPRYAAISGNATYTYLYLIYCSLFACAILLFEVSLGQYKTRGFSKIFSMCPLLEGLTTSIVVYCIVSNMFYNMFNVYSMLYIYSSFYSVMPHSICSEATMRQCRNASSFQNQTTSPEYLFFYHNIVRGLDNPLTMKEFYNWRNACLLILVWVVLCFAIIFGLAQMYQIYMFICIFIVFTLVFAMTAGLCVSGATSGLYDMFVPRKNDLTYLSTWVYPFEQMVVSGGFAMGPFLTFWSHAKFKAWGQIDCILIIAATVICSLVTHVIMYSAFGVLAYERHTTVGEVMDDAKTDISGIQVHVLFTQLFNRLSFGLSNFTVFLFYFMLSTSSFYTAVECVQIVLLYLFDYSLFRKMSWIQGTVLICFFGWGLANILCTKYGFRLMVATDHIFIASALLIIIACELVAVLYFYGLKNYCDDIEFLLSFIPSYFFQVTWLFLPVLFLVFAICSLYLKGKDGLTGFDVILIFNVTILGILLPIILRAMYRCVLAGKKHNFKGLFLPGYYINSVSRETNPIDDLSASGARR